MAETPSGDIQEQKIKPVSKEQEAKTTYLKDKEAICNSTKGKLNKLKQECSVENVNEKESDLKEILDETINEVINNYLKDINSPEGINLSREGIYNDVIEVFDGLGKGLDKNNIFVKDIELIKNNFLLPKDKGIGLIDFVITEKFSGKKTEFLDVNDDNVENYFSLLKSSLGTLYEIGNNSSPKEMATYLKEFKKNPEVSEIFQKFPDLGKILFEIVPTFINSVSKEKFIGSIGTFLDNIKGDIVKFSGYLNGSVDMNQKDFNVSKLNILNNSSQFLRSLINKDNVSTFSKKIKNLKLVTDNEVVNELLVIINGDNLTENERVLSLIHGEDFSDEDKLLLADKILEGIEVFSAKEITDNDINNYINSMIGLISMLSKNIPESRLFSLINKFNGGEGDIKTIDIDFSLKEFGNFLSENKNNLYDISSQLLTKWYDGENVSIKELIIEVFKNDIISKNLNLLGEKLVENLRKITKIDLTKYALDFRKDLLKYNFGLEEIPDKKLEKLSKIEGVLITSFGGKLEKSVSELITGKLNSENNNNLKKEEVIGVVLKDLKGFLKGNTSKVFEYAKELGFNIESKQDRNNILKIINSVLDNTKLTNIISKVIENLGKSVEGKADIVKELNLLIKDSLKNRGGKLLEGTENNTRSLAFDTFYNNVLGNKENIKTILSVFGKDLNIPESIDGNSLSQLSSVFKKYINKDIIKGLVDKIDIDNPTKNIKEIAIGLYEGIENKTGFINELLEVGIIEKVNEIGLESKNEGKNISTENINTGIDLLYTTFESSNKKDMSDTLNKILEKSGLGELTNMTILGKNMGENIVSFLSSVNKNELKTFLGNNNDVLNKLIEGNLGEKEKLVIYTNLSTDLIKIVDIKKFQNEYAGEDLDSNEKLGLDLADEFKEVISEKGDLIKSLVSKGKDISDIFNGTIDIDKVDPEIIKSYGKEVFDLLNSVISKVDNKYLGKNMEFSSGGKKNEILDMFISSFMGENKWFLVKEGISGVFDGFEINKGESIDIYFRESDNNRENFGDTLYDFLKNKSETDQEKK